MLSNLLAIGALCLPQAPSPSPSTLDPTPPPSLLVAAPFHGVWIDPSPAGDGNHWCRGDRYKMSFGADGASFLPLFSSRAPRHWPLHFRPNGASPTAPQPTTNGFVYHREQLEERWELRPEGAEQSFVLAKRPDGGALVIEVDSDAVFERADAAGLHFVVPGWGEVCYGNAFAVGADAGRTALATTYAAGRIRIDLPADATYPLVVDPFVATIGVASNEPFDNRDPDVAYNAEAHRWCVAMAERVSLTDTDIKVRRFDDAGTLLDTDYFETGNTIAVEPSVAAAFIDTTSGHATFGVAWREGSSLVFRRVGATHANPDPAAMLFDANSSNLTASHVDLAGSRFGTYATVFMTDNLIVTAQLRLVLVGTSGSPVPGTFILATGTGCLVPKIADMRPPLVHWVIAWSDQVSGCLAGDVKLMAVQASGVIEATPITIAGAVLDDDRHVELAWDGVNGLIVWDRDMGTHRDVFGQLFTHTAAGYLPVGPNRDLTSLEPGIPLASDQHDPVVATDGTRFAVAYLEGNTPKPFCATFAAIGGTLVCHEGHIAIATANLDHENLGIAAMGTGGGPATRYFVVTDERDGINDYDVQGLFYDGRQAGAMFATVATGCVPFNAAEPTLAATGTTDLGHSFTVTLSGHRALPFVLAGVPLNTPQLLCTVLLTRQCRQGVALPPLVTSFGTQLSVNVPRDVGLVGMTIAFQGIDVLATGACGPNLFGSAFAVSDTIEATIR